MKAVIDKDTIKQHTCLFYMIENQCRLRYSTLYTMNKETEGFCNFVGKQNVRLVVTCIVIGYSGADAYNTLTTNFLIG